MFGFYRIDKECPEGIFSLIHQPPVGEKSPSLISRKTNIYNSVFWWSLSFQSYNCFSAHNHGLNDQLITRRLRYCLSAERSYFNVRWGNGLSGNGLWALPIGQRLRSLVSPEKREFEESFSLATTITSNNKRVPERSAAVGFGDKEGCQTSHEFELIGRKRKWGLIKNNVRCCMETGFMYTDVRFCFAKSMSGYC